MTTSASAIIVAAGGARRMGFDKLTAPLGGQPVLCRTVAAFLACPEISQIIVVTSLERQEILAAHGWADKCEFVLGGAERHLSVWQGLLCCRGELVAVHDGARPLVSPALIAATLRAAEQSGAAAAGRPITDTLKRVDAAQQVVGSVDRQGLWAMETPQTFRTDLLKAAYQRVLEEGLLVTDEVSAYQILQRPVTMVAAGGPNPKMTFPEDFAMAERLL